jgi:hypothetical protein
MCNKNIGNKKKHTYAVNAVTGVVITTINKNTNSHANAQT